MAKYFQWHVFTNFYTKNGENFFNILILKMVKVGSFNPSVHGSTYMYHYFKKFIISTKLIEKCPLRSCSED